MERVSSLAGLADLTGPDGKIAGKGAEAAREFEAYMVTMLARELRSSVSIFSEGAVGTFGDLFDQEIGRRVAETGGLGLQDSILRSLDGAAQPLGRDRRQVPAGHQDGPVGELVAGARRVSSGFGLRLDPFSGVERAHHGLDIAAPAGSPVRAAADGVVRYAGKRGGYGNVVILSHADGTETRYAHCKTLAVRPGDRVEAGADIATVGSTGRSTGPHLHFEVRRDGQPIDPATWLEREDSAQVASLLTESAPER